MKPPNCGLRTLEGISPPSLSVSYVGYTVAAGHQRYVLFKFYSFVEYVRVISLFPLSTL